MNLPNKLTLTRMLMVPLLVILLLYDHGNQRCFRIAALVVFCIASFTDFLDGMIARRYNLVTNFGKFMDPLADKLLVSSALICLVELSELPAWYVILVISREFIISGFRLIAAGEGLVIAASWWGKVKTVFQMAAIILLILNFPALQTLTFVISALALILTVISLADYIYKNRMILIR